MTFLQIGDLARLGGVSVRMLRHYHEIGLLVPERVDDVSGYRWYEDGQLAALHKIVTLKDLGLSLSEIDDVLNNGCDDELGERLMRKREQAVDEATAANERIERIDRYVFGMANGEPTWPSSSGLISVEVKPVEARRVAQLTGVAESWAANRCRPGPFNRCIAVVLAAGTSGTSKLRVHQLLGMASPTMAGSLVDVFAPSAKASPLACPHGVFDRLFLRSKRRRRPSSGPDRQPPHYHPALLEWIDEHATGHLDMGEESIFECGPDMEWITEFHIRSSELDLFDIPISSDRLGADRRGIACQQWSGTSDRELFGLSQARRRRSTGAICERDTMPPMLMVGWCSTTRTERRQASPSSCSFSQHTTAWRAW